MDTTNIKLAVAESIGSGIASTENAARNSTLYVDHGVETYKYLVSPEVRDLQTKQIKDLSTQRLNALRMRTLGAAA